jgi:hypothetical protein
MVLRSNLGLTGPLYLQIGQGFLRSLSANWGCLAYVRSGVTLFNGPCVLCPNHLDRWLIKYQAANPELL